MDYKELVRIIFRRWWLIVLPLALSAVIAIPEILGGGTSAPAGYNAEIRYSAAQRQNMPGREGDYTDVWMASEYTVDALTDWVRTSSFRDEIRSALGDAEVALGDAEVALESLRVAADNVRSLGVLYLSHSQGDSLRAIADAAVLVLSSRSQRYFPQLGGEAAQVTILQQPAISSPPPALTNRLAPFIRLAIALMIGLVLAFFAEFVDPTIYHQDDLRRLGMPLLGSIPKERA